MWSELRLRSDWQLLNLDFPALNQELDDKISWLITEFVSYAWTELWKSQNMHMNIQKFFGFLTFKYGVNQLPFGRIPFLD